MADFNVQIPLVKGEGKSRTDADYVDLLPTNIVPIAKQVEGSEGYFRFWPGLTKLKDVSGVSRGSHYNTAKNAVYRVMGTKMYSGQTEVANVTVSGTDRVSMAHGRTSQAVVTNGVLNLYGYDGTNKVMSNWPATTTYPESVKTIQSTQHSESGDSIAITALNEVGHLTLTVTPTNANNVTGFPITINESEWATGVSQSPPGSGIPYITDLKVSGIKFAGATLYVSYTFMPNSGNATDISKLEWVQTIPETTVENMQYDFTPVGDVCRIRGRYVFNKKGTDSFFLTSLDDESKPDRVAAEYRAENMPDAIIAMREFRDFVLAFGSSTVEFYKLTGDANNLISFASSYMVSVGLCGQFALAEFADTFAFITSPARGQVQVVLMGQGSYTPISDRHVNKLLSTYTPAQLAAVVVEGLKSEDNEFLILHLPDHTVVFNATSKLWNIIKTGVTEGGFVGHRAIDYRNEGNIITCGDKIRGYLGYQDFTISSQYGEDQEIILYSPLITQERAIIFDLQLTANTGLASQASRLYISITTDGHNYGRETLVEYDGPYKWLSRTIMQKVGMVIIRMGFKIRVVGATPCTLSNLRARAM